LLKGGISIKQVPAGTGRSETSTAILLGVAGNVSSRVALFWWVAFGTLLGPGTTTRVVCPGFPHTTEPLGGAGLDAPWGCLVGALVGMCVVGLLFENYIVNASIFYKKAISLRK